MTMSITATLAAMRLVRLLDLENEKRSHFSGTLNQGGEDDDVNNGDIGSGATGSVLGFDNEYDYEKRAAQNQNIEEDGQGDQIVNGAVGDGACGNIAGVNNGIQISVNLVETDGSTQTTYSANYGATWKNDANVGQHSWNYGVVSAGYNCKFYYNDSQYWTYGAGKQTFPHSTSFKKITCSK